METFKDNFSRQSAIYAKYRPLYPDGLYAYLSGLTAENVLAWDCGTGNGQAAMGLAKYYQRVIATDPSEEQIRNALPEERVEYRVEQAEKSSLASGSADIVTLANALHWLDFDRFYPEVNRVLKPGGIIAAWCYGNPEVSPEIDEIITEFHDKILGDYWLPENRLVEKKYDTIPFPFQVLESPDFSSEKSMNFEEFIGYLNTWSATQRFIAKNGVNPTDELRGRLLGLWGKREEEKKLVWKLVLKVGRVRSV